MLTDKLTVAVLVSRYTCRPTGHVRLQYMALAYQRFTFLCVYWLRFNSSKRCSRACLNSLEMNVQRLYSHDFDFYCWCCAQWSSIAILLLFVYSCTNLIINK